MNPDEVEVTHFADLYHRYLNVHTNQIRVGDPVYPASDPASADTRQLVDYLQPRHVKVRRWLRAVWRWWHHEQPWPHA